MKQLKDNGIKELIRLVKNELKNKANINHNHDSVYSKLNHTHSNYLSKSSPIIENGLYWKSNNNGKRNLIHLFQSNTPHGDGCGLSSDGLVVIHAGEMSNISKYILNSSDDTNNIRLTTPDTEDVIISSDSNIRFYVNTQNGNKADFKSSYIDKDTGVYMGTANKALCDINGKNIEKSYIKAIENSQKIIHDFYATTNYFVMDDSGIIITRRPVKIEVEAKFMNIIDFSVCDVEYLGVNTIIGTSRIHLNTVNLNYHYPGLMIVQLKIRNVDNNNTNYISTIVSLCANTEYTLNIYGPNSYSLSTSQKL